MKNELLNYVSSHNRKFKIILQIFNDIILVFVSFSLVILLNTEYSFSSDFNNIYKIFIFLITSKLFLFYFFKIYLSIIRYSNEKILFNISSCTFLSIVFLLPLIYYFNINISLSLLLLYFFFNVLFLTGSRFLFGRLLLNLVLDNREPIAIYGAGSAGKQLLASLTDNSKYKPLLFIDDDPKLVNLLISNLKVFNRSNGIQKCIALRISHIF